MSWHPDKASRYQTTCWTWASCYSHLMWRPCIQHACTALGATTAVTRVPSLFDVHMRTLKPTASDRCFLGHRDNRSEVQVCLCSCSDQEPGPRPLTTLQYMKASLTEVSMTLLLYTATNKARHKLRTRPSLQVTDTIFWLLLLHDFVDELSPTSLSRSRVTSRLPAHTGTIRQTTTLSLRGVVWCTNSSLTAANQKKPLVACAMADSSSAS